MPPTPSRAGCGGGEHAAWIEELRKGAVIVTVGDRADPGRESPLHLTLAQGVSRGERMDWVVQKATELGVSRIVPVLTGSTLLGQRWEGYFHRQEIWLLQTQAADVSLS